MEEQNKEYCFLARPGFMVREIAGETTLIPIDTDNVQLKDGRLPVFNGVIQLNELALLLWNSIETPKTLAELVDVVQSNFDVSDVDEDTIIEDIKDFLSVGIVNQVIFMTERG